MVADIERAGARRWLERMNSKLREGGKKEEKRRLKEFMENAYRCDPRVIARREEQKAERCAPRLLIISAAPGPVRREGAAIRVCFRSLSTPWFRKARHARLQPVTCAMLPSGLPRRA